MLRPFIAATLAAAAIPVAAAPAVATTANATCPRLAGTDRVATAAAVAEEWESTDTIVVVDRGSWADAAAAAPVAGLRDAPIVTTDRHRLSDAAAAVIAELSPREIVVVGAEAAVSRVVAEELRGLARSVVRVGGSNRYETAAIVATSSDLPPPRRATVAVGEAAVTATGVAAAERSPLLHSRADRLSPAAATALAALDVGEVVLVGDAPAVAADLEALGVSVAAYVPPVVTGPAVVAAATPDVAVAAAYAAHRDLPLGVTGGGQLAEHLAGATCAVAVGGPAAISDAVLEEMTEPAPAEGVVLWRTPDGSTFRTAGHSAEDLVRIEAALGVEGGAGIPNGRLVAGDGGVNTGHAWHLVEVELVDMTIELCDGNASDIDEDLDYWLGTVGRFCPWAATPVVVEGRPEPATSTPG